MNGKAKRDADDTANATTVAALRFSRQLHGRFNLPVATIDERLSSWEAERRRSEAATASRHRGGDAALDSMQRDWLTNEIWAVRMGMSGERSAAHYIDHYYKDNPNLAVIHDLRLELDGEVAQIDHLLKTELKGKIPSDKICLKDGDESGRPEFAGKMTIKASTKRRPLVINRDKSPITAEDNIIYAGCYTHAIISLWAQNNGFGKRINASLDGVQFARDGEPFGDGGISANEFDAFGDEAEEIAF